MELAFVEWLSEQRPVDTTEQVSLVPIGAAGDEQEAVDQMRIERAHGVVKFGALDPAQVTVTDDDIGGR